jgi:hypothetical protein
MWCALLGAGALALAWQLNDIYWKGLNHLPTPVDNQGNTASVDAAMQGLDAYGHLQRFHTLSIISLVIGVLFAGCMAFSTSQRRGKKENPEFRIQEPE